MMGKDNAEVIASDGVLLGNNREITDSFNYQRMLNPKIKQPVGHIALSFKPEDKPRLTNEFMAKIVMEYMDLMVIKDTQFILVRHNNTDNPHCHLVYNRIGYDGKVISSQGDYKRNEIATKKLKDKYRLTYAEDKGKTNVKKLRSADRVKYEIHNAVKKALKSSKTWKEFNNNLAGQGVKLEFVKRSREIKTLNDIQGIRFTKDGLTFKASQISRDFSFAKLNARLSWNKPETEQEFEPKKSKQESIRPMEQRISLQENGLLEGGLGLFLPSDNNPQDEQIPYDELLRRRKKKKRKKRLSL
ncbi:Mobilization protein BmgA [Phocaeicola vulgatus]|uniref:Mobilization protein BmgA n=1 Tax=Phocaeicola vulgatus TaxID=821 RepID=A0A0P0M576_PHOVU|nr:Mobilization protein BmgA [Phocaeicola vulgatus]